MAIKCYGTFWYALCCSWCSVMEGPFNGMKDELERVVRYALCSVASTGFLQFRAFFPGTYSCLVALCSLNSTCSYAFIYELRTCSWWWQHTVPTAVTCCLLSLIVSLIHAVEQVTETAFLSPMNLAGNAFSRVCLCVCASVCPVHPQTFESLDQEILLLVLEYLGQILISRSSG